VSNADLRSPATRPAAGRLFRLFDSVGQATLRWLVSSAEFAAFAATAFAVALRRDSWRRPVRAAFLGALHRVAVQSALTTMVTGALLGFALITQVVYWLQSVGQSDLIGTIVVRLLVREIVPVVTGLVILGRVGIGTLVDLGEARPRGWLRQLERQGIDPMALIVMPRVLAYAVGAFCLSTILVTSTLLSGYVVASSLGLIHFPIWQFVENVERAMDASDFYMQPLKCMFIGMAVALVCCATALSRVDERFEMQRLVQRGFIRAALAILVVNAIFDLAE
jgi:phospholipid/cholesterol/gamma-HCH transport system permease protein